MPRPVTFGVLAHVDAGKTTLCEQMLYRTGVLRAPGRVDHGDAALDASDVERERGITVFSNQAWFTLRGRRFTLIDTPGHVDFSAEAERAMLALDMVILLIDGGAGVQGHTVALFKLAMERRVPILFFINKTDLPGYDEARVRAQIAALLSPKAVRIRGGAPDAEELSLLDDAFCEAYLDGGAEACGAEAAWNVLRARFAAREAFPLLTGAALNGDGVEELLDAAARLAAFADAAREAPEAARAPGAPEPLRALVYQVRREPGGERVTYVKLLQGTLRPRDSFLFGDKTEKAHQLRLYQGVSHTLVQEAAAGDAVGVTGLSVPRCGDSLCGSGLSGESASFRFAPVLAARVSVPRSVPPALLLEKLRLLEDEEPTLRVAWDAEHGAAQVSVMGEVQTEILIRLMSDRFGLEVGFLPPLVLYRETIAAPVIGCGHYEPLRHYAEAHLRLSPAPRGSGVSFASRCHVDDLPIGFQNLIRTHALERTHPGALTGAPLTDVTIELLSGRAHLKHTEGGDFREATYRAIRQGLCKAESVLLEPFYRFTLLLPTECLGRAMTDVAALCGTCDPPEPLGEWTRLRGRAPVASFMSYPAQVRAYTHGKGDVQLEPDGYDPCHNPDEVIAQCAYQVGADVQNPAGSVFCAHGAGFFVAWDKADAWMHLPVEKQ